MLLACSGPQGDVSYPSRLAPTIRALKQLAADETGIPPPAWTVTEVRHEAWGDGGMGCSGGLDVPTHGYVIKLAAGNQVKDFRLGDGGGLGPATVMECRDHELRVVSLPG